MLEPNQLLQNRYRVVRPLGHGGMGAVFEAIDTKLFSKPVALKAILIDKTLIPNQKSQKIFRRAFEREAKILTQLDHEAFPKVIDYFVENDCQFLVMELIRGKDLSVLLRKRKTPFELEEVLPWALQLLEALDYLHTLNPPTIHRDIKPQNLKLTARKRIKLLDFGIAKGADFASNITLSNQTFIAATFNYSPFEQVFRVLDSSFKEALRPFYGKQLDAAAAETADARSDIYALGATLYHLLTKQLPFDALKRRLEIWAGNCDPLPTPQTLNPKIPEDVSDWVMTALQVEKEKRFESAAVMRDLLNVIIETNRIREDSTREPTWQKELEILQFERQKLEEERQEFEYERQRFLDFTQETLSQAVTERDLRKTDSDVYKTNKSIQSSSLDQQSVTTIVGKSEEKTPPQDESFTEMTATSYLVDIGIEGEAEKTELAKIEQIAAKTIAPVARKKSAVVYPASLFVMFLLVGAILFGLIWQNSNPKQDFPKQMTESANTNRNEDYTSTPATANSVEPTSPIVETKPEAARELMPSSTVKPVAVQRKEVTNPTKPFSQMKPKLILNQPPVPNPTPTPQAVKKPTPPSPRAPKPKNPDCIFNNDCRQ